MLRNAEKTTARHARGEKDVELVDTRRCHPSYPRKTSKSCSSLQPKLTILCSKSQVLKRKERELEYEMERLAKEKITAQNRILFLKRELTSFDIDCTKLTPEAGGINDLHTVKQERGEYKCCPRFSSRLHKTGMLCVRVEMTFF
jgi:hypothetical protein